MKSYLGWRIDFAGPLGAPAFTGPDSMSWRVFKNPVALGVGGVAAVLLEFADPRIRSGVWDHSTFRTDPIGRSQRTGMAAMVGVYAPREAARRVIASVTNMHARVEGKTPDGQSYRALDTCLLDWVSATATFGFVTAYDRFVAPLSQQERDRFYAEGAPVAALYGVRDPVASDADFHAMLDRRLPKFEPHPIVREFLCVIESGAGARGLPKAAHRALARASVSILPAPVRARLQLGPEYDLGGGERKALKALGALAERIPVPGSPPVEACKRLGLPGDFLHSSRNAQARALTRWNEGGRVAAAE